MPASLRNVAALIAALAILQLSGGLIGVRLPLAFTADGFSTAALGLVAASFSAGFMIGAASATTLLARVGPIRVYAACAAIFSAATLALHFAGDVWAWTLMRLVAGVAVALLFASLESWMAWSVTKAQRGEIMGVYMVSTKAAQALGPFLAFSYIASASEPWMIAGAVAALSMVPVCFTSAQQPDPPKAQPLALVEQFATAPAAVIACFGAGFVNGAVLQLAPLYANFRFGETAAANFYAAALVGSLLIQWPAGRLSDRIDRRIIIAGLSGLAFLAALALALIGARLPQWSANVLFLVWGAGALSFYGIAVAHMADRAEPGKIAQSAAGLLFVWAGGSVLGPLVLGFIADYFGAPGLFSFAAVGAVAVSAAMFWRRTARASAKADQKEDFAPYSESSVAAAELAHGPNEAEKRQT